MRAGTNRFLRWGARGRPHQRSAHSQPAGRRHTLSSSSGARRIMPSDSRQAATFSSGRPSSPSRPTTRPASQLSGARQRATTRRSVPRRPPAPVLSTHGRPGYGLASVAAAWATIAGWLALAGRVDDAPRQRGARLSLRESTGRRLRRVAVARELLLHRRSSLHRAPDPDIGERGADDRLVVERRTPPQTATPMAADRTRATANTPTTQTATRRTPSRRPGARGSPHTSVGSRALDVRRGCARNLSSMRRELARDPCRSR